MPDLLLELFSEEIPSRMHRASAAKRGRAKQQLKRCMLGVPTNA